MFTIKLAELDIRINNKYDYVHQLCRDYISSSDSPSFCVSVSDNDIDRELSASNTLSREYAESICIYRAIADRMIEYGCILFHAAVISLDGEGYAFAAKSGTGKTTHISLWLKVFGNRAAVINGDKPIIKFLSDGSAIAYGTPWCGKERLNSNSSVRLKALCFIKRGEANEIRLLSDDEITDLIFHQVLLPSDTTKLQKVFSMLNSLIEHTPCYELRCNISEEAALVAYNGMKG